MQRRVTLGIVASFYCLRADRFSGIFSGDMDAPQFHDFPNADVDKFMIRKMSIGQLRNLCGHVCDLANRNPYLREPYFDDKLCVISSPVAVYIPVASRGVFVESLLEHFNNSNRFLAPRSSPTGYLSRSKCSRAQFKVLYKWLTSGSSMSCALARKQCRPCSGFWIK